MTISSLYIVEKEHLVLSVSKKTFWILQYWLKIKITCDEHRECCYNWICFMLLSSKRYYVIFILAATSFISSYGQSRLCLSIFLSFLVLFYLLKVLVYSNFVYLQLYFIQAIWKKLQQLFDYVLIFSWAQNLYRVT